MKSLFKVFTTFLVLILLASNVSAIVYGYTISGNIKDNLGVKLQGATISDDYYFQEELSDTAGYYTLGGLYPPGPYQLKVTKTGYTTEYINVRVVDHDITDANAYLTKVLAKPTSFTLTATDITQTTATIRGEIFPNGLSTNYDFTSIANSGEPGYFPMTPHPSLNIGSGTDPVQVSAALTGLTPNTQYTYVVRASNSMGFDNGDQISFTTLAEIDNGILKIRSNINAKAYVDNIYIGNTGPSDYLTYFTTAQDHTVKITQTGYVNWISAITVKSDKSANPYTYVDANLISNDPTLPKVTIPIDKTKPSVINPIITPDAGDGPAIDLCAWFGIGCPADETDSGWDWGFDFDMCSLLGIGCPPGEGWNFNMCSLFGIGCSDLPPAGESEPAPAPAPASDDKKASEEPAPNIIQIINNIFSPPTNSGAGASGSGNNSAIPTKSSGFNFWWLLLIALIIIAYANRKKIGKMISK